MVDLNKEREAFLGFLSTKGVIKVGWNSLGVLTNLVREAGCTLGYNEIELMQEVWMEKAKNQLVPETHVLVEKSKISTWWQDADEPENFASTEEQLLGLIAESEIHIDDMLVVEKHIQAQLSTQKLYCVYQITNKETGLAEIKVCESKLEAEEILNNNAKWVAEKEADQYESMNAFFEEEERKSGAEQ